MQIETYEVTECGPQGAESEPEALALIESLGLEGQKTLVRGDGGDAARIPYERMNAEQVAVYRTLFPEETLVEKYARGPIPIRVLQVIAHGRELFGRLVVRSPASAALADPVLIGRNADGDYLLARWGEALEPFEKLRERATVALRQRIIARCQSEIAEAQATIAAPDAEVLKIMGGGWSRFAT